MKIMIAVLLACCFISFAYAHPNHMNFEAVKHDNYLSPRMLTDGDKITHKALEEQSGHTDVPCTEQHKSVPCEKKSAK